MAAIPEVEAEPGEANNTKYATESKGESYIYLYLKRYQLPKRSISTSVAFEYSQPSQ
jgi:hypothetical protein